MKAVVTSLAVVVAAVVALTGRVQAHPILVQHHDRTVILRLKQTGIEVDYEVALDALTLLSDLVPFQNEIDPAQGPKHLFKEFARLYGPRIAGGLVGTVNGIQLKFSYVGKYDFKQEDHLRYVFRFE